MTNKNRRSFIKQTVAGGLSASALPYFSLLNIKEEEYCNNDELTIDEQIYSHNFNSIYNGETLNRVAFPIGGIGAGMFCIEGTGAISHMSVRNHPELFHEPVMFAAIAVKGENNIAKILEGPVPDWKKFGSVISGNGHPGSTYGLPRFRNVQFNARFPFCEVQLQDEDIPLRVEITGWSPFIPTDEDSSSLPVGALEYKFINKSKQNIEAVFSYNSRNFLQQNIIQQLEGPGTIKKIKNGFVLSREGTKNEPYKKTDFALIVGEYEPIIDYCWFRGGWWDSLTYTWNTIKNGKTRLTEPVEKDAPGASMFIPFSIKSGEEKIIKLKIAWYSPESNLRIGKDATYEELEKKNKSNRYTNRKSSSEPIVNEDEKYKPWYSSRFKNIFEVCEFWNNNYCELRRKSKLFSDSFFESTLPAEVLEAVSANLTILKSPTVLRQDDGRFWAWEGCRGDDVGCCPGSCTHVWNYAQALPHLFPALERSLRRTEFCENQNQEGHQMFRAGLPIRPIKHDFHAAADGQLGGIMKLYRDWRISGDTEWMKELYPYAKKSLDYCIRTWDPGKKGYLEEPHHNTYDIEFWGPNGMCTSFYIGALTAFIEMSKTLKEQYGEYESLLLNGKEYLENELFDGEYFIQKIKWEGLEAPNPVNVQSMGGKYSEEALALLKKEGPKYQYGTGCLSDGIVGAWIAFVCGLDHILDKEKVKKHLKSVFKYNFRKDLSKHSNPQRPTYAMGSEGGLLLCTWPKCDKMSLPFVYSDEVWTGIEYQVASHLISMDLVNEGLEIVRTCRLRYDGRVRNPFNEYEAGSWYARAMSSYALFQSLTGVRYDAVDKILYIDSKIGDFTSFLSTQTGFGTVGLKNGVPFLNVFYGKLEPEYLMVSNLKIKL